MSISAFRGSCRFAISFLNSFVLVKGIRNNFVTAPLHQVFLKTNLVSGPVTVGIMDDFPVEGITFLLDNDLAGTRVHPVDCDESQGSVLSDDVSPTVQEGPCDATSSLDREYPETFAARSMSQCPDVSITGEEEPSVKLADTFFVKLMGVRECNQFSREALIVELRDNPSVAPLRETAMSVEESQEVSEGFYLQDDVLM